MRIAYLDGGAYYHHATFHGRGFSRYFAANIYAPELDRTDLDAFDCLYVASRQDPEHLRRNKAKIDAFLEQGKTLVVMGDNDAGSWVPGARWESRPVNFWWWLTPGADSGLRVAAPEHDLMQAISIADFTWHQHGVLTPPEGAVSLIDMADGGSIFYDDRSSTKGRILATTLDPCYHNGSYFMPAATRFLQGFLPWLAEA
ncbi:hypothetical protein AGMMS49545_00910 [Betaproteobacteria bacterium]|nr:hypothetical protein AGMMS49545_00910 [Betaproteobacteria bacterium]